MFTRTIALTAALLAAATAWSQPDLSAIPHKIVCESLQDGNWELMLMDADGSDLGNLTRTPDAHELYPHVSPDGSRICFVTDRGEGRERTRTVCLMNIDGTERVEVGPGRQPCWSPDGTVIAYLPAEFEEFTFTDSATKGIMFYRPATKEFAPHPNDEIHHLYNLCWAPNGDWFVATVHAGKGVDHAVLAIEASGPRVVNLGIPGCRPDLSPDGTKIVWGSSDWDLTVADIDWTGGEPKLSNRRNVVSNQKPTKVYHADWCPDGRHLAFSRGPVHKGLGPVCEIVGVEAPGWNIAVADTAGENEFVEITHDGASYKEPDWVPVRGTN